MSAEVEDNSLHLGQPTEKSVAPPIQDEVKRGVLFWLVIIGINISSFLALLEATIITNALPTIVNELHGVDFVWIGAAYNLTAAAFMPTMGALAQVFGRKVILVCSLLIYSLGSALCGGAQNMSMLIAGRAVLGLGGSGLLSISQIILSDIVPLSERGTFNSTLQFTWCLASGIGPIVGGTLAQQGQWRWIFLLNLPIAPVAGIMVITALHLKTPRKNFKEGLYQLDWIGNALIVGATCSFTIAIVWGGVTFPWHSARVLAPLCIGGLAFILFGVYEYKWSPKPIVPFKLMMNWTTISGYIQVAIFPIPFLSLVYYLPLYFQACKGASPTRSGVLLFGVSFSTPPIAILAGIAVTASKRYRPQLWLGWILIIVGLALLGTTHASTSISKVIGYEFLAGAGFGVVFAATYFPALAPIPITLATPALAFFAFVRQFSQILGIVVGGVILQNQLAIKLPSTFSSRLANGGDAISVIPQLTSLPPAELNEVREAFAKSLGTLWNVMAGISGVGFLSSLIMKHYDLHTKVDEDWGVKKKSGYKSDKEATSE